MSSPRKVDVIIVGAGQSGLATAYFLKRHGIETLLLDGQEFSGGAWLKAWNSLKLFSPRAMEFTAWLGADLRKHLPHKVRTDCLSSGI